VAGPSGSGKSRLSTISGLPVFRLDDFYRDGDDPCLPRRHGIVDWDHIDSWDVDSAVTSLSTLLATGQVETPIYSIPQNRAVASRLVTMGDARQVIAEGIFAIPVLAHCRRVGLGVLPIWLDRHRSANFGRRLHRDLAEHRKPADVLLRRGVALWRDEPRLRRQALQAGFLPFTMSGALQHVVASEASV